MKVGRSTPSVAVRRHGKHLAIHASIRRIRSIAFGRSDQAVAAAGRRPSLQCDPHGSPCHAGRMRMQLDAVTLAAKRQSNFVAKCRREYAKHATSRQWLDWLEVSG